MCWSVNQFEDLDINPHTYGYLILIKKVDIHWNKDITSKIILIKLDGCISKSPNMCIIITLQNTVYNMRDRAQIGHLISPNKTSSTRNCLYEVELLTKGIPMDHPKIPCCSKLRSTVLKLQTRPSCWRQHFPNILNMEKASSCLHRDFPTLMC